MRPPARFNVFSEDQAGLDARREERLAYEFDRRGALTSRNVEARAMTAADASQRNSAAVLVVALACAFSGLLMGLCLAASPWPVLSFVFGALFAGGAVWFMRDLLDALRR